MDGIGLLFVHRFHAGQGDVLGHGVAQCNSHAMECMTEESGLNFPQRQSRPARGHILTHM